MNASADFSEPDRAFALRTLREAAGDDAARVEGGFLLCISRPPSADEQRELLAFLAARVLLKLDETVTKN